MAKKDNTPRLSMMAMRANHGYGMLEKALEAMPEGSEASKAWLSNAMDELVEVKGFLSQLNKILAWSEEAWSEWEDK